jgi:hypothetical protein
MTAVVTGLNSGLRPSIAFFKNFACLCDGDNIPRYLDQNGSYVLMHVDPTTAITAVESGAGAMSGVFKYLYTEYNKNSSDGDMFSGHETNPSPIYTTGALSSNNVVLTLPGSAVNTGFTHLKIYRTDAGGSIYYYIGMVAIGTTTFTDNNLTGDVLNPFGELTENDDGSTSVKYLNYRMSNYKFIMTSKTRLFAFGVRIKTDGTVTTNGTTAVVGVTTKWTKALEGSTFYCNNGTRGYIILTVTDSTHIVLAEAYTGANASGQSYTIEYDDKRINWSAQHPITAKPLFWSFPTLYYRILESSDATPIMGGGMIEDRPVIFKQKSHYLLTESGNDFLPTESNTKAGTCSHWSIVPVPDNGGLLFVNMEGKLYLTSGIEAAYLGIDLTQTEDGINLTYAETCQAVWYESKRWYVLIYLKLGSTTPDRMLIYDYDNKQFVIWEIPANCIAIIESSESGQIVNKPWIGTIGGFIYKMMTGNNLGVSSGTVSGTTTSLGAATLTDTTASFYTTADGLKDVYLRRYTSVGVFIEQQKILSNTGTIITVDTNWTNGIQTGETYEVGGIDWSWKSKIFDFGQDASKVVENVIMMFKKALVSTNVRIHCFFSDDSEMSTTSDFYLDFNILYDYDAPVGLYDNRTRYFQFEISGHGAANPVEITSIVFNYQNLLR